MSEGGTYRCPYPSCDWEPSRPLDSDVRLTQVVVDHETEEHRKEHAETDRSEAER